MCPARTRFRRCSSARKGQLVRAARHSRRGRVEAACTLKFQAPSMPIGTAWEAVCGSVARFVGSPETDTPMSDAAVGQTATLRPKKYAMVPVSDWIPGPLSSGFPSAQYPLLGLDQRILAVFPKRQVFRRRPISTRTPTRKGIKI